MSEDQKRFVVVISRSGSFKPATLGDRAVPYNQWVPEVSMHPTYSQALGHVQRELRTLVDTNHFGAEVRKAEWGYTYITLALTSISIMTEIQLAVFAKNIPMDFTFAIIDTEIEEN